MGLDPFSQKCLAYFGSINIAFGVENSRSRTQIIHKSNSDWVKIAFFRNYQEITWEHLLKRGKNHKNTINNFLKWRLNLHNNTLYTLSLVFMFPWAKDFSYECKAYENCHLCKVSLWANFVIVAKNYLEVKNVSMKNAIWRATFWWL